jgi:predicted HicB family RNase H-like nuclease
MELGGRKHLSLATAKGKDMIRNEKKEDEVERTARRLFSTNPDWVTFYREILGLHGVIRHSFSTREALSEFKQTQAYEEIQHMLTRLRERGPTPTSEEDPTRVITVRLPRSLHEALRVEAHEHHTSMNKLCISKLLRFIDHEMIPAET